MHSLPRPRLVPLCRKTPEVRRHLREYRDCLPAHERPDWDRFQRANEARLDRERLWRIRNERHRLFACHWAGWRPSRASTRRPLGVDGPKWLGGTPFRK